MDMYDYETDIYNCWTEENEYLDSLPVRYAVWYEGHFFEGDSDKVNVFETESREKAMEIFHYVSLYDDDAVLYDNYYDVKFSHGEWDEAV